MKLVRMPELLQMVPVSRPTIYRWVRDGQFPKPVKLGPRSVAWNAEEVQKWLASKK